MMPKNAIAGCGLLVVAVAFWLGADAIPESPLGGGVGADGLPKLLAIALGILSCILIAQSVLAPQREGAEPAPSPEETAERRRHHLRAFGILVIGIGYLAIVGTLGYLISVGLLIGVTAIYIGRRPSLGLLAVVVIAAAVFYVLFVHVLSVPLPSGFWPELFRDVG